MTVTSVVVVATGVIVIALGAEIERLVERLLLVMLHLVMAIW